MISERTGFLLASYKVQLSTSSSHEVSLAVTDLTYLASYANKSVKLQKIVASTLIKALEQKDPIMSVQFQKVGEETLLMKVTVSSPFLQTIEEDIQLPSSALLAQRKQESPSWKTWKRE